MSPIRLIAGESIQYIGSLHWKIFFSRRALLSLFVLPIIDLYTSKYIVTTHRVVAATGFFSRCVIEINLHKVEAIHIHQSLLGRLLGYGAVVITGSGGTRERIHDLRRVWDFHSACLLAIH